MTTPNTSKKFSATISPATATRMTTAQTWKRTSLNSNAKNFWVKNMAWWKIWRICAKRPKRRRAKRNGADYEQTMQMCYYYLFPTRWRFYLWFDECCGDGRQTLTGIYYWTKVVKLIYKRALTLRMAPTHNSAICAWHAQCNNREKGIHCFHWTEEIDLVRKIKRIRTGNG